MNLRRIGTLLAVLVLAWLARESELGGSPGLPESGSAPARAEVERSEAPIRDDGGSRIAQAFAERESGFMVTVDGSVAKVLPDDRDGSRHQRLLLRIEGAPRTVLVAHNIDLAERVPAERGDRLRVRGQYEWNEKGGVLHWTHHDPDGNHPGGWIEVDGRRVE